MRDGNDKTLVIDIKDTFVRKVKLFNIAHLDRLKSEQDFEKRHILFELPVDLEPGQRCCAYDGNI